MIYLIGGAPRVGKSILCQRISAKLGMGWTSTDLLVDLLRAAEVPGAKSEWDATPQAITAAAEWFAPYLERFLWGVSSLADHYVIEGVEILPAMVKRLSSQFQLRPVFLGCSQMTLARFDAFLGRSHGYASLPVEMRSQFAHDIPLWSAWIKEEARRFDLPYVDTGDDFEFRLSEAEEMLAIDA